MEARIAVTTRKDHTPRLSAATSEIIGYRCNWQSEPSSGETFCSVPFQSSAAVRDLLFVSKDKGLIQRRSQSRATSSLISQ